MLTQCYMYYTRYSKYVPEALHADNVLIHHFCSDVLWLKLFVSLPRPRQTGYSHGRSLLQVLLLLVADTVNCVFDIWWIYGVLVGQFGEHTQR